MPALKTLPLRPLAEVDYFIIQAVRHSVADSIFFPPAGQNACVDGGFAQCVGGEFVITPCAGGLQCVALPLVNKPGTSITCDTLADALARIAATGASGGLTG